MLDHHYGNICHNIKLLISLWISLVNEGGIHLFECHKIPKHIKKVKFIPLQPPLGCFLTFAEFFTRHASGVFHKAVFCSLEEALNPSFQCFSLQWMQ